MKVYGYMFQEPEYSPYPQKATNWDSIADAKREFARFVENMLGYSTNVCYLSLYRGEKAGDEETLGYPDYPDYLFLGREDSRPSFSGWAVIKKESI